MSAWRPRMQRGYALIATVVLNTLVLVVLVDVTLTILFWIKDRRAVTVDMYDPLDDATLAALYPGRRREDVGRRWQAADLSQPPRAADS